MFQQKIIIIKLTHDFYNINLLKMITRQQNQYLYK